MQKQQFNNVFSIKKTQSFDYLQSECNGKFNNCKSSIYYLKVKSILLIFRLNGQGCDTCSMYGLLGGNGQNVKC